MPMLGIPLACRHSSRQKVYKDMTRTLLAGDKLPNENTYSTPTASLSSTTGGNLTEKTKSLCNHLANHRLFVRKGVPAGEWTRLMA